MRHLALKNSPPIGRATRRDLAPGAGLVIAGLASLTMWAMIAGIAAIV